MIIPGIGAAGAAFSSGAALKIVNAVDFDGTNDYLLRGGDLTGNADSKSGIISVWLRIDAGDGSTRYVFANEGNWVRCRINAATNKFVMLAANAGGTDILSIASNTARTAGASWLHMLISWDLATAAAHWYINDASDLAASPTLTDDTIDYTRTDWAVGSTTGAGQKWDGCMAEVFMAPGQYLDFSVVSNRRKFISATGKPVDVGSDGSLPTGVAPRIFLQGPAASFGTNSGTGGNFSITGTLDTASTSPSD